MAAFFAPDYNAKQLKFDAMLRILSDEFTSLVEENERLRRWSDEAGEIATDASPQMRLPTKGSFSSEKSDTTQIDASRSDTMTPATFGSRPSITQLKLEKLRGSGRNSVRAYRGECVEKARSRALYIIEQRWFDIVMGMVIMLNSACLGAEGELQPNTPSWLDMLEQIFLWIYLFELAVRLLARGWTVSFRDPWFLFDFALVITSCIYSWIVRPITVAVPGGTDIVRKVVIFRVLRLLRLLRALRLVPVLKDAWKLTYGLITATNTMISTLALLLLALYLFACLGIELITRDPVFEGDEIVSYYFGDLLSIMLTLVQFVTMDSISSIYTPLIKKKSGLALYFLSIILIISVALMNLVTAVLVDRAQENSSANKEEVNNEKARRIAKSLPMLGKLFRDLDRDDNGAITLDELCLPADKLTDILGTDVMKDGHNETMKELFEVLDVDASGKIGENEFVDGLMTLALAEFSAVPSAESVLLLRLMRSTRRSNDNIASSLERVLNELPYKLGAIMHEPSVLRDDLLFI